MLKKCFCDISVNIVPKFRYFSISGWCFLEAFYDILAHTLSRAIFPLQKCPATPDYSECRLNMPCNPNDVNPCGCPHACCAASKTYYIAKGSSGEQRGIKAINHTSLHFSTHYCFKKGECNQLCGGVWSLLNNVDKCGCGEGLKCSFDVWHSQLRCFPWRASRLQASSLVESRRAALKQLDLISKGIEEDIFLAKFGK